MKTAKKNFIKHFLVFVLVFVGYNINSIYGQGGGGPVPTTATTGQIVPLVYCAGDSIWVPYTDSGTFAINNVFTVELSDATGDFSSPVIIGSLLTQINGIIGCQIPWNTPAGLNYRVRVMGSEPYTVGTDNGQDIEIKAKSVVTFTGAIPDQCENLTTLDLTAYAVVSPAGGVFSGSGVSGTNFSAFAAGSVGSPHSIIYTYTAPNGCANSDTNQIVVLAMPVVSFSNLDTFYCTNFHSVVLVGTPAGGTFSGPGMTGSAFNPADAGVGIHTITYTYYAGNGCSDSASQTIEVDKCTNLSDIESQNQVNIFPNPSSGCFYIESQGNGEMLVEIFSSIGKKVLEFKMNKGEIAMADISFVSSGLYFVRVEGQFVQISIKK